MDEGVVKVKAIAERAKAIHLADKSKVFNTARVEALEVDNLMESALATMVSAAARRECRGAHTVSDYERPIDDPETPNGRNDAEWMKHTLWYQRRQPARLQAGQPEAADGRIDPAEGAHVLSMKRTDTRSTPTDGRHRRPTRAFQIYRYDPDTGAKPRMQTLRGRARRQRAHAARRADEAEGGRSDA